MNDFHFIIPAVNLDTLDETLRETLSDSVSGVSTYTLDENSLITLEETLKTAHRMGVSKASVGNVLVTVHASDSVKVDAVSGAIASHDATVLSKRAQIAQAKPAEPDALTVEVEALDIDDLSDAEMKKALKLLLLERKQKSA